MVLLDALGRRGALRILWELRAQSMTFRALLSACESNPGSLNTRIKELRSLGVIDHQDGGYFLTDRGHALVAVLNGLQAWADEWAASIRHT